MSQPSSSVHIEEIPFEDALWQLVLRVSDVENTQVQVKSFLLQQGVWNLFLMY